MSKKRKSNSVDPATSEVVEESIESSVSADSSEASSQFVDDDELILNKSVDTVLEETDSYGVFKQDEGVVSWSITNFVDANEKVYSKRELKANPPVLTFEDSTGAKAEFVLTKEFSGSLSRMFERVYYGYYGLDKRPKKKYTWQGVKDSFFSAIGARPIQSLMLFLVFILAAGAIIFQ